MSEDMDKEWEEKLMNYARELPVDALPSSMLEERTVRELRSRGLLRKRRGIPSVWLVGSVAASLALFATGIVVGQYLGTRNTATVFAEIQRNDAAARVQQAGSAYVQALQSLRSGGGGRDSAQAREVALTALHAAANEMVSIAPNDPVVAKILQGLEQEKKQTEPRSNKSQRNVVWF
ncbi:MAG TPA: hypothetical protein VM100_11075 [Longimicrobiales bacterium]|nr:hypothetical protein [Longimicrobiales bacterium]